CLAPDLAPGTVCDQQGFTQLGRSPGISDDGKIVTFNGVLNQQEADQLQTRPGPGIFASIDEGTGVRRLVRIAGGKWNATTNICDASELGFDSNNNPLCFSAFDDLSRVGVAHLGVVAPGYDDSFVVVFIATPNGASRDGHFSGQTGIWTV